jgi:hypothetical protein
VAITSALFAGLVGVSNLLTPAIDSLQDNFYLAWFAAALFSWGLLATSRSFRDLHDKNKAEAYLLLPASSVEKTLARLLSLTALFVPFLLVLAFAVSLVVEGLNWLFAREQGGLFSIFDPRAWKAISQYLVIQSYFFLGAVWFRRMHFIKTSLTVIVTFTTLAIIGLGSVRLFFGTYWWNNIGAAANMLDLAYGPLLDILMAAAQLTNFVVIPGLCWYTAYLRVRETQVSNAI